MHGEPTPGVGDVGDPDATTRERLDTAERLLADERLARRHGLERVLAALGRPPGPDGDVRVLEDTAAHAAAELRRRYDRIRHLRYP